MTLTDEILRHHANVGEPAVLTLQSRKEFIYARELQLQDMGSVPIGKYTLLGRVERQLYPRVDNLTDDRQPLHQDCGTQPGNGVWVWLERSSDTPTQVPIMVRTQGSR